MGRKTTGLGVGTTRKYRPLLVYQQWMDDARCARIFDTDWQYIDNLYFPEESGTHQAAKRREAEAKYHCARCPVQPDCLAYAHALDREFGQQEGIYGGMTPVERVRAREVVA